MKNAAKRMRDLSWAFLLVSSWGLLVPQGMAFEGSALDRIDAAIENLGAENVEVRRNAALQIRHAERGDQRKALPILIELLRKEKDGQVRLAVLDTVTALGPDAAAAVPALVHTLRTNYGGQGKEESHQDYRSALALAAIGRPAVEDLRGLLNERKESVRAEVIMALGRIGPDADAAIPDLLPLLGDRSDRVCRETIDTLSRLGPAVLEPLVDLSEHQDVKLRARAIACLGPLTQVHERAQQAVLKGTHDEDLAVRVAALRSLAKSKISDDVLLPILIEAIRHADDQVRWTALNQLVGIERRALLVRMASELELLLTGESDGVARDAAFLLGRIGVDAAPRLFQTLPHEKSRVDQIAESLAQIGPPVVSLLTTQATQSPEPRVRRAAALALGRIRPLAANTVPTLIVGLEDPEVDVKLACLTAIRGIGPRAKEAVPAVRGLRNSPAASIRLQVIDVLAQSAPHDGQLVADLTGLLDDPDPRVQRQAIDVIRTLGPLGRQALPALIGKLGSSELAVRASAIEAVGTHGQAAAEAVPALTALLDDATPKLRMLAARTLGGLGRSAQPAQARLTALLEDKEVEVREATVLALGSLELDVVTIRPALVRALRDERLEVRRAAARAIQRQGPQGVVFLPDIIQLAESQTNFKSVERLLRSFERTGPDVRSLPELVNHLSHEQADVRLLAIKFLGLAGEKAKDAIPALERLREDPSAEVRKQAEAACERIRNPPSTREDSASG